jgi:hypothetical protein
VDSITATDTTIQLDSTSLADAMVWVQREAVRLGSHVGAGAYDSCLRGQLGTTAAAHSLAVDRDVFGAPVFLTGRRVELFWWDDATAASAADEHTLWTFSLRGIERSGATWAITLGGIIDLLREAELLPLQWVGEITTSSTGIAGRENGVRYLEVRQRLQPGDATWRHPWALTAWGNTPLVGDSCLIQFRDSLFELTLSNAATSEPRYWFDPGVPVFGDPIPQDELEDMDRYDIVREVFVSGVGALGYLGTDAATLALVLLTSTEHGSNGAYDSGIPFGPGIARGWIDTDAIIDAAREDLAALAAPRFFVGLGRDEEDDAESALERIEGELLHPFGLVFSRSTRAGAEGRLTIRRWAQGAVQGEPAVAFDDDNVIGAINESGGLERQLETIRFSFNAWSDGSLLRLDTNNVTARGRGVGRRSKTRLNAGVVASLSQAYGLSLEHLQRWDDPYPILSWRADLAADAPPGMTATLTNAEVIGKDAATGDPVRGVTASLVVVIDQQVELEEGQWIYRGLHLGIDYDRLGAIAPSASLTGSVGGGVFSVALNAFIPSGHPLYAADALAFQIGAQCLIVDQYGSTKASGVTFVGLSGGPSAVELSGLGAYTWASGDLLLYEDYDNQLTAQREVYASLADANGELGAAGDRGYQYR